MSSPFLLAAENIRYRLIDIGTLGGPSAYGALIGPGGQLLNNSGAGAQGESYRPSFKLIVLVPGKNTTGLELYP